MKKVIMVLMLITALVVMTSYKEEARIVTDFNCTKSPVETSDEEPCPPYILSASSSIHTNYGDTIVGIKGLSVTISFKFEGYPRPGFDIYKGNSQLFDRFPYHWYFWEREHGIFVFEIKSLKASHEGVYKLVARNAYGEDTYSFYLKVIE